MQRLWEAKENKKKERNVKGRDLVDVVFSWSLPDVLNPNLYKEKVLFSSESFNLYFETSDTYLLLWVWCVLV